MRALITLLTVIIGLAAAADEKYYQTAICTFMGGQAEYRLPDNTRVDCLTSDYAIEFDFAPKWAESIGQSLYYGLMTGKHPAVVLIIKKPSDMRYLERLKTVAEKHGITVFYTQ